jgi:hypothetical protein
MTAVATKPAPKAAKAPKRDITDHLQMQCMQVDIEIAWFSTTRQAGNDEAAAMLRPVNASRKGVSITKRLFSSKHEAVKNANAARQRLRAYIESMTIPVAAIVPRDAVDPAAYLMKQPSTRLILRSDIDEFDNRVQQLTAELYTAARALDDAVDEIKALDRQTLGTLYDDDNYKIKPSEQIAVRGPLLSEVGFRADFADIAPRACERAMAQLRAQLQNTVTIASQEFSSGLAEAAESIAAQLANRTRLRPLSSHKRYAELYEAEVVNELRHADDADVQEGHVLLQVRLKKARGSGKSDSVWLEPMSEAAYAALRPTETDERRKVYDTTVEHLREQMQMFHKVREMLGSDADGLGAVIDNLEQLLTLRNRPARTDELVRTMRTSSDFRNQFRQGLQGVVQQLRDSAPLVASTPRRRLIAARQD